MLKIRNFLISGLFLFITFMGVACKINTGDIDAELGVDPNTVKAFIVTYKTEMGSVPKQIALVKNSKLLKEHLPVLKVDTGYYDFAGWFIDDELISAGKYKVTSNITLTAKWIFNHFDYKKTDTSGYVINPSGNSYFSGDGEYVKVAPKSSSIANWRLTRQENGTNYSLSNVYGFEMKVKCDSNIDWAGMQWLNTSGFSCYYFEVHGDGSFKIRFHNNEENIWEDVFSVKLEDSHVILNDFNTLCVKPSANSNFEVYVNDYKVYEIQKNELKITPGPIAFAATSKKSNNGKAWFKFTSYSQVK